MIYIITNQLHYATPCWKICLCLSANINPSSLQLNPPLTVPPPGRLPEQPPAWTGSLADLPPELQELLSSGLLDSSLQEVKEVLLKVKANWQDKNTAAHQERKPSKPSPVRSLSSSGIHRNKYTR